MKQFIIALLVVNWLILFCCLPNSRAYSQDSSQPSSQWEWYKAQLVHLPDDKIEQMFDEASEHTFEYGALLAEFQKRLFKMPVATAMAVFNRSIDETMKYKLSSGAFYRSASALSTAELTSLFRTLHPDDNAGFFLGLRLQSQGVDPMAILPYPKVIEYLASYNPLATHSFISRRQMWWYPELPSLLSKLSTAQIVQLKACLPPLHPLGYPISVELQKRNPKKVERPVQSNAHKPIVHPVEIVRPNQPPQIVDGDTYNFNQAFVHPMEIFSPNQLPQIVDADTYKPSQDLHAQNLQNNFALNSGSSKQEIGVLGFSFDPNTGVITKIFPPSDLNRFGIHPGDQIVSYLNKSFVKGCRMIEDIEGTPGTPVEISFLHDGAVETIYPLRIPASSLVDFCKNYEACTSLDR